MSRNFGLGSRDMNFAGKIAIENHYESFASMATVENRWSQFVDHVKEQGIKRMEQVTVEHIRGYAQQLVDDGLRPATQQNYVSAVNVVMEEARQDREIRLNPSEICDSRTGVAEMDRSVSNEEHEIALDLVNDRIGALLDLQREFGLRFEESAKMDCRSALDEALNNHKITIEYGTKGGQTREVEIQNEHQIEVLSRAVEIQQNDRSMIPEEMSYREFKSGAKYEISKTDINFHEERHTYAQNRYEELVGHSAPIQNEDREEDWIPYLANELDISPGEARELDSEARMKISEELGHHREDVVAAYVGGKG